MKLGILSCGPNSCSTRRFVEAAESMRGMVPVKTRRRRRPEAKQLVTDVPTGSSPTPA